MKTQLYDQYMMAILSGMAIPIGMPKETYREIARSADMLTRSALEYSSLEAQKRWTQQNPPDGIYRIKVEIPTEGITRLYTQAEDE